MTTTRRTINANMSLSYALGGNVFGGDIRLSNFALNIGIGSQSSNLDVEFIYDTCGQAGGVSRPTVGRAVRFQCNSLVFGGIINSVSYGESAGGSVYKLKIIDPRKVLENVSILLQGYYCDYGIQAPNFINIASFIENGVAICPPGEDTQNWPRVGNCNNFGRINSANGVFLREALAGIQRKNPFVYTTTGEPLYLNLGKIIAITPGYAKTEASTSSLLALITQACDEGACDFIVSLVGTIIDIMPINRGTQPPSGLIGQVISSAQNTGTLISGEVGEEELYENSNKVVLGENVQYLRTIQSPGNVAMMLGTDLNDNAIRVYNTNFRVPINISTLAAGFASQGYSLPYMFPVSEEEILAAGTTELWKLYGLANENSLSGNLLSLLNMREPLGDTLKAFNLLLNTSNLNDFNKSLDAVNNITSAVAKARNAHLYELAYEWFAQDFISTYYGKKWLVPISYICANPAPQSNKVADGGYINLSDVPSDGGWPNDYNLLGLTYGYNTSLFETPDGRLSGFLRMNTAQSLPRRIGLRSVNFVVSPEGLDPSSMLIVGQNCYVKVQTEGEMFRRSPSVAEVLITSPFLSMTPVINTDIVSEGLRTLAVILGDGTLPRKIEKSETGASMKSGANIFKMGKPCCSFDYVSVPMKSNIYVYGPWTGSKGSIGSTTVEQTNLSPWNYGGFSTMNMVGQALAQNGLRLSNKTESGSMTLAEPPGYSIEYFINAAIVINSIGVNFNSGGATTTYSFQTYSQKFGQYGKAISDSIQKSVKIRSEILGYIRTQRRNLITASNSIRKEMARFDIKQGKYAFQKQPPATSKSSPSYLLVGGYYDPSSADKAYTVGLNSTNQFETSTEGPPFQNLAIMSLDGLLSPVSLQGRGGRLPRFATSWGYEKGDKSHTTRPCMPPIDNQEPLAINRKYLNPIVSRTFLQTWEGRGSSNSFNIRVIGFGQNNSNNSIFNVSDTKYDNETDFGFYALRGPLVLQSWGYDTEGKPIPNAVDDASSTAGGTFVNEGTKNKFMDNWLSKPESWPVGPIDLRYDRDRGVWVAPAKERILLAKLTDKLDASGVVNATLMNETVESMKFHENYKVWGPNGEDIMSDIESHEIKIYNYLDNSFDKDEVVYAVWNDDKYLAIPKGGTGSTIRVGKFSDESWNIGAIARVSAYKVNPDSDPESNINDPSIGGLVVEDDVKYENLYALNLFADIENSGSKSLWVAVANIGKDFHILIDAECSTEE
jgi:hypothetical protein